MVSIVYVRTLQKAADLLGGRKKLARHLRVAMSELEKWMAASEAPPMEIFLRAVEIVLDEPGSDPAEPSSPRDCARGEDSSALF